MFGMVDLFELADWFEQEAEFELVGWFGPVG